MSLSYRSGLVWLVSWILLALPIVAGAAALARIVAPAAPSPSASSPLIWPKEPTPDALFALQLFVEPLVPVSRAPSVDENRQLLQLLRQHAARVTTDDVSLLTTFVRTHPDSPWRVALLVNLGLHYYQAGYFSLALDAWEDAWRSGREEQTPRGRAIVDRAVGELVRMHARIGHAERLRVLFAELEGRTLSGSAAESVRGAREGLWMMEHEPGVSFLCGPMALKNVFETLNPSGADLTAIQKARSAPGGFSLQQVQELAQTARLPYRMAKRLPGAALPLPAVAHWKVDHYAALVGEQNGLYHLKDPTFGNDLWISKEALDHETSGYFLIADQGPLPEGWEPVTAAEAKSIHGMGITNGSDPSQGTPDDDSVPSSCPPGGGGPNPGMARHDFLGMLAGLRVRDTPLHYVPGVGPEIRFTVTYNQREAGQPANFNFSNLGPRWSHNWMAYVVDKPSNLLADVTLIRAGGGYNTFAGYDAVTGRFGVDLKSQAVLVRTKDNPDAVYRRLLPDGSQEVYAANGPTIADTRQVFLTQVIDPQGNAVRVGYDKRRRLITLTDGAGKVTRFAYEDPVDAYKITRVTDPAGRAAVLTYRYVDPAGLPCDPSAQGNCSADKLSSVTDAVGIVSGFGYRAGSDFLDALVTPYGTTAFESGDSYTPGIGPARWVVATDPLGHRERIEYRQNAPGIGFSEATAPQGMSPAPFNAYLNGRNTFFWDKNATAEACRFGATTRCDYTKAHLFHWLHGGPAASVTQDVLESEKAPLESRIWYTYPGQTDWAGVVGLIDRPTGVGRVLDDGSTRLEQYSYNALGQVTRAVDAAGRTRFYEYAANRLDLLRVWQKVQADCDVLLGVMTGCDLVEQFTYNGRHRPLTHRDLAGRVTTYAYNAWGQVTLMTNALNEVSEYAYIEDAADPNYRRLVQVKRAGKVLARYTYDAAGRVRSDTDAAGYRRLYARDGLDRITRITYPDGTTDRYVYERLDLASRTDRNGHRTGYAYNALGQLTQVTYPKTPGEPDRIVALDWCGCGALERLTDGEGRLTRWRHDLQGRVTGKFLPGNTGNRPDEAYLYEASTGRLKSIARQLNPGPEVRTDYRYFADDRLQAIVYDAGGVKPSPTPGVALTYDPVYPRLASVADGIGVTALGYYPAGVLGAGQLRDEDGPWPNDTIRYSYDALGRPKARTIDTQGRAQWTYDALGRVAIETNPLGTFSMTYLGATGQLRQVDTHLPGAAVTGLRSVYAYAGNAKDRTLRRLEHWVGAGDPKVLLSAYDYTRDTVGNITHWTQSQQGQPLREADYDYDAIDQLTRVTPVAASAGRAYGYTYDRAGNRTAETVDGATTAEVSNELNQLVQRGVSGVYQYDSSGNTLSDSAGGREYRWNGADQLVSIVDAQTPGNHSDFVYDALGRVRVIQEYKNAALSSEKRYLWCGTARCEERNGNDAVLKRYYDQGELRGQTALYYSRDHLGSVREATNGNGALRAQYAYDPWGRVTKLAGNLDSDVRYTGHFYHAASGLHLAPLRAYAGDTARWLGLDPIRENGGLNLYGYVGNNPLSRFDPLGLCPDQPPPYPTKPDKEWGPWEYWQAMVWLAWQAAHGFSGALNGAAGASGGTTGH